MKKHQKMSLSFLLVIILAVTSSYPVLSQADPQSWIKRRLTRNAGASWQPAIAVSANNIHVVWRDDTPGNREIYYKHSTDNGVTWGKQKRLTKNAGASSHPAIAVSGNNIHVVWYDDTPGNWEIFYKRSNNNGATWSKQKRLTSTAGVSYNPVIAVSGNNIHVSWSDATPGNWEIYYKRSSNNGATWSKQKRLTKNAGGSSDPAIAVSGNNIHVVWFDTTPGNPEIYYKRSSDNGATWGKQKRLTNDPGVSEFPTIAVSGNNVHVVWDDLGNREIYYRRSINNGVNWGKKKRLTKNSGWSVAPTIDVLGDNIHVVWHDSTPGNEEIYYKPSRDNGATWGKQKRLTRNVGDSYSPAIALSSTNVHVVWTDDSPGNNEIFYKRGP